MNIEHLRILCILYIFSTDILKAGFNQSTNVYQVTSPAGSIWFAADLESQRIALPNARSLSFREATQLNCQLVEVVRWLRASGNFSC